MTCDDIRPLLADLAEGLSRAEVADAIEAHLEGCARCRGAFAEQLALATLEPLPGASAEPTGQEPTGGLLRWSIRSQGLVAALALAALLAGLWWWRDASFAPLQTLGAGQGAPSPEAQPLVVLFRRVGDDVQRLVGPLPVEADLVIQSDADEVYVVRGADVIRLGREAGVWIWRMPRLGAETVSIYALRTGPAPLQVGLLAGAEPSRMLEALGHAFSTTTVRGESP